MVRSQCLIIIFLVLTAYSLQVVAQGTFLWERGIKKPAFTHPGMAQQRSDLEFMKREVLSGKEPFKSAFERLQKAVDSDQTTILAFVHLSQGPYGADDQGGKQLDHDAKSAYDNALMWYITGNRSYAQKAIGILNIWAATLWDFDDNNAKLLAGLTGHYLLNSAEILRYSGAEWQAKDIANFKQLMYTVYYPLIRDFFPQANGNWDASMINTMLCIGVFCDDRRIFDQAVDRFYWGSGNGGITKYIYPGGQIQETSRDWGHVQLGIGEFAKAAAVAWSQGIDLYSAADNRLAEGFEYTARYMLGGEVQVYGNISTREREKFRDIYESIYEHYHRFAKLEMPYASQVIAQTRPRSGAAFLSSVRLFDVKPKSLEQAGDNKKILRNAGALAVASMQAPAGAVMVKPGQSIQRSIDACGGKPCWIVLEKGIHRLSEPLRLADFVTLSGKGKESVLMLEAKKLGRTIVGSAGAMHDVTLRDFLIEGATSETEGEDPNNYRRTRSNQNAPSREGVVFSCDKAGEIHHIKLIHLTVQNFTKNGVAIKGGAHIEIDSCNFSGNGSSVVPGPGTHHNLLITHGKDLKIRASRFDDSPWGTGMVVLLTDQIMVTGCELARNKQSGLLCSYSKSIVIRANLAEGNDADGIDIASPFEADMVLEKNWCWYNGGSGLKYKGFKSGSGNNRVLKNKLNSLLPVFEK